MPERFLETRYQGDYAPFGIGDRSCLGVPLTRAVARRFLRLLADGYSPEIIDDGPRQLSAQRHWAPNRRRRVRLVGRAGM
jgi:cytochrome P450